MSIDKSLRRKNTLARSRNVLTRGERILALKADERWTEGRSPYNLPKVRVMKVAKKAKKAAKEEATTEGEAKAAAPAAPAKK
jgi:small basic protein (TIGR04137 family)